MIMKLFGTVKSRAFRCLWLIEELGIDCEFVEIDFAKGDHRKPEFLQVNPNGKVPAFQDGDLKLFESAAICQYLVSKVPDSKMIPKGDKERAIFDQWMFFVMSELEQPLWTMGKHTFALPAEHRVEAVKKTALYEWNKALAIVDSRLGDEGYILGNEFSLVDIMIGQTLQWARMFKIELEGQKINAYRSRVLERPSFQRTVEKYVKK